MGQSFGLGEISCEEKDDIFENSRYSRAIKVTYFAVGTPFHRIPCEVCLTRFMEKVGPPWFVVDDPAATQFSLQSSVLQMQANTVYWEREKYKFKGRLINNAIESSKLTPPSSPVLSSHPLSSSIEQPLTSDVTKLEIDAKKTLTLPIEDSLSPKSWRSYIL